MSEKTDNFIKLYSPVAVNDSFKSQIPPSIKMAQAILESGWGTSGLTVKAKNFFGIKAGSSWKGQVYNANTHEYYDGSTRTDIKADFRAYHSAAESFKDHSKLLTRLSRYRPLFELDFEDYKGWAYQLKKSGYATSPTYPQKLISIIEKYNLSQLDREAKKKEGSHSDNDNGNNIDYNLLADKVAQKVADILIQKLSK